VTLRPGETREFPFDVKPTDKGWQGLVSWAEGSFSVTARRADGTTLDANGKGPEETYTASEFRTLLASSQPLAGRWAVRVTANKTNDASAQVDIRVFDSDDGSAVIGVSSPKKDLPFMVPSKARLSTIKSLKGVPIHVYLQPAVGFGGKVSEGIQLPESVADPERTYKVFNPQDPTKAWEFSVADFGWKGPGLNVGPLNVQGPQFKPSLDVEDPLQQGLRGQALVLTVGPAATARYTQEFPVAPRYAALNLEAEFNAKAGAVVADLVPWAAVRVATALGTGALTGGAGTAVVTGVVVSASTAQWIDEATTAATYLTRVLKITVDARSIVQNLTGSTRLLVEQLMPRITAELKQLLAQAVKAVQDAARAAINRAAGAGNRLLGVFGVGSALTPAQFAAVYAKPRTLSARRLSGRLRFRQPAVKRSRIRRSLAAANRYAPSNPVRGRRLLLLPTGRVEMALAEFRVKSSRPRKR